MDRAALRVLRRIIYLALILCLARLAFPRVVEPGVMPAWYEVGIQAAAVASIIALVVGIVGGRGLPHTIARAGTLLAGLTFLTVSVYVLLTPGVSVFVSQTGLAASDIGLGVLAFATWRVLERERSQEWC